MNQATISQGAVDAIVSEIREYGEQVVEAGAFLLSRASDRSSIALVAFPLSDGITRERDHFAISSEAIAHLFEWAGDHDHSVVAQLHSHRRGAFLSLTDVTYGFNVAGFTSAVVPHYESPSSIPAEWGWWTFVDGQWELTQPPEVVAGGVARVEFDARGVYEA